MSDGFAMTEPAVVCNGFQSMCDCVAKIQDATRTVIAIIHLFAFIGGYDGGFKSTMFGN